MISEFAALLDELQESGDYSIIDITVRGQQSMIDDITTVRTFESTFSQDEKLKYNREMLVKDHLVWMWGDDNKQQTLHEKSEVL